jgi:hypothetical protein
MKDKPRRNNMAIEIQNLKLEEISEIFKTRQVGFSAFSKSGQKIEKITSNEYEYTTRTGKTTITVSPEYKIIGSKVKWFI